MFPTLLGSPVPFQFLNGIPSTKTSPICCPIGSLDEFGVTPLSQVPLFADGVSDAVLLGANANPLPSQSIPSGPVIHLQTGQSVFKTSSSTSVKFSLKNNFVKPPLSATASLFAKAIFGSL